MSQHKPVKPEMESFHYEPKIKPKSEGLKRVAAYCRVSTLAEEQELSFETQCSFYKQLIERDPGMVLVGIYGDQGFSGLHSENRKEFQRLIKDCEDGLIDMIMVKSISRFSRNTIDCIGYLKHLKKHGVAVLFEKEGLNSMDPQTEMILSIFASMAQSESCSHSENIRWARQRRDEIGDPIRGAPYGYRNKKGGKGDKNNWLVYEPEARKVRRIFQMAYRGYTTREIRETMDRIEEEEGSGISWTAERIRYILRNESYRGDILTSKIIKLDYLSPKLVTNTGQVEQYYIEGHHEPIVDPAVYDEALSYFENGYLNGHHSRAREKWLRDHPEILLRRETDQ